MQEQFNQYCLTKEIASKPSGPVYLAHRINDASEKVTLKVFNTAYFTSEQQSQNFLQKIEKIRELKHPSIVPILDFGVEQGQPYVVREYLASASLRQQMSPQGLDLQEALKIIFQIGHVLRYAHQHQIIHGNLKPENIFFKSKDEIMISDFGITSFISMTKPQDQSRWESTEYLAPEQYVGALTQKSDQYALACLTYELLTGQVPFSAQSFSPVVPLTPNKGNLATTTQEPETACENSQCPDYGKAGSDNVRKFGKTRKGMQRWQCKTCRTTWSFSFIETTETPPQTDLLPLSDLVPNLPEEIEEIVLKAMVKDPSERYANISIFLNALQIALLLPTIPFTNSPALSLPTSIPKLVEKISSEVLVTTPVREQWKKPPHDDYANKDLRLPDSDTYLPHKASVTPNPDIYLPHKTSMTSSSTHFSQKVGVISNPSDHQPKKAGVIADSATHLPSKTTVTSSNPHLPSKDRFEALPEGRRSQFNKPLVPTLWLAFALSGIVLLLGTLVLYALIPSRSPASLKKLVMNIPTAQPSVQITPPPSIPTAQPSVQITPIPTATPTIVSTQTNIEPAVSNTCNGPGWSKQPNNADPSNDYYVVNIDGNASCYQANWFMSTGSAGGQTCDFTTYFDKSSNVNIIYNFIPKVGNIIRFQLETPLPRMKTFPSLKDIASIQLVADHDRRSRGMMSAGPFTVKNCH